MIQENPAVWNHVMTSCVHVMMTCSCVVCVHLIQAAKPKAVSGSEKENNPVRTPEALPEAKKAEYRLLKEEIAR